MNSFLMIGQSNMAGRGHFNEVEPIKNALCHMLRMGRWQGMDAPVNPDRNIFNPDWHSGICLAIIMGAMVTICGLTMRNTVLSWMQTPESCMEDALLYTGIYFLGAVSSMVYNMGAGIMRAMGDSRRPTIS